MATLRAQRRAELTDRILDAAQAQLLEVGPAALSLRAVARDVGVTVSGLYRYYAGRDDLLTALLVRAFDDHADAVQDAVEGAEPDLSGQDDDGDRLAPVRAGLLAYRRWGLENPTPFGLAYGTPVPGYAAPADETVRAGARCGDLLVAAVARGRARSGAAAGHDGGDDLDPARRAHLKALASRRGYDLPPGVLARTVDLFVVVHGFVVMDVFGQLRPLSDNPDRDFAALVDRGLDTLR
ncbi:transcriptional regulator, TetR family [Quadrisphaera granulorum]|uniref:TetR family transcriptional regulator n=1 Tax=Quadrisphaera granulorum TaxID=317664 RepID=A0A316A4Q1_9ACTN|nr:TetR/AcrR family transcriptional regulator [Quadrisphaera granulorum]PWJ51784.1 TetR family transcriptional regulator [Quadrisphaera granulorum]SZE97731.1 transcriptional regulator, TetR family [Quadrisphaera granulorum]